MSTVSVKSINIDARATEVKMIACVLYVDRVWFCKARVSLHLCSCSPRGHRPGRGYEGVEGIECGQGRIRALTL